MNQKIIQKKQPPGDVLQLQLLIEAHQIKTHLQRVAIQLEKDYNGEELIVLMVAKGAFILVGDLVRHLHLPVRLEMIGHSAGEKDNMQNAITSLDISGKHLLIVDTIFDAGENLANLIDAIKKKTPASVKSLVLLSKQVPHCTSYRPDFVLFEIEDRFVVGYGLSYKEYYRGLPDIYAIER